jgi:hypothetical protein
MSFPSIDKLRKILKTHNKFSEYRQEQPRTPTSYENENNKKQLYDNVVEYIKKDIIYSAQNGLKKTIFYINTPTKICWPYKKIYRHLSKLTTDKNHPYGYGYIYINRQMLTDVVQILKKEDYIVKYLSNFNNMKGISIEWQSEDCPINKKC